MLELMLCSMVTVLPDYLFRRYVQDKRIGREINLYTVWYELRWGITACLLLTVSLITLIFYFHPSTSNVTAIFRTVTILPELTGRVAEVFVGVNSKGEGGSATLPARQFPTGGRKGDCTAGHSRNHRRDDGGADGACLRRRAHPAGSRGIPTGPGRTGDQNGAPPQNTVSVREVERLQISADGRKGALDAAIANKQTLETKIAALLPAQKASAEAALAQAQVDLDKTTVRAGIAGTVQQFTLRAGDVVNTMIRPAGIMVPEEAGRGTLIAGFGQIEAQVMKVGMIAEATCIGKPFKIIPMVVTDVQDVIAAGQFRATDQLIDLQQISRPERLRSSCNRFIRGSWTACRRAAAA